MTPVAGIAYFEPSVDATLKGLDDKINIPIGGVPIPLLEEDIASLDVSCPSYDAVGRGIYQLLRANPDAVGSSHYAQLLQQAYPHYLSELASHIVMLDRKDVEVSYLDRKINYLKIFALLEPENAEFPFEIGKTLLDKGLRLSALHLSTVSLYRAADYLEKARQLQAQHLPARNALGEVYYLLGKYEKAASCWSGLATEVDAAEAGKLAARLKAIEAGELPRIPAVDYLEAVAVALGLYEREQYDESAAILQDIIDDAVFRDQFPLPELYYYLALCCKNLAMPKYAEEYLQEALRINPEYEEARAALAGLY
ncbi:tetratricopeptide repeat protein [Geotalea sp. SG265]|uniref:tetratricopeptide repeat protein n=1 Tax=Geotalea sp. SG265 TaxID=2922867 RepID=UPI001FAF4394|nr:tetratricopeptide repeat protein [Geotalea sp. SG265]